MTMTVDHTDPAVITLAGSVTGGPEAMAFSEAVGDCLGTECAGVIVDLSGVELINSSGLGMLVAASRSVGSAGRAFALVGADERVRSLLAMTRLDTIFTQYETLPEAIDALSAR